MLCDFRVVADAILFPKNVEDDAQKEEETNNAGGSSQEGNQGGTSTPKGVPTLFLQVIMHFTKHKGQMTWSMALLSPRGKSISLLHFMKRMLGMDAMGIPWLRLTDFGEFEYLAACLGIVVSYSDLESHI